MLTVLSLLDDRLRPKGARDPLAIESIWSAVGRKLVGNLTTVTSRADHFMVALLACRYAHEGSRSRSLDDVQERYARPSNWPPTCDWKPLWRPVCWVAS